jgi:BlaI family transcriptional regulator, penicillinase repressor
MALFYRCRIYARLSTRRRHLVLQPDADVQPAFIIERNPRRFVPQMQRLLSGLPRFVAAPEITVMNQPAHESDAGALTELQMAVIGVLWDTPGATLADVTAALRHNRELAPTTVATLLSRLEARGAVRREGSARAYRYYALVTQREARQAAMQRVRNTLFGGDTRAVMAHLISESPLSADEAEYLRRLIDGAPGENATEQAPRTRALQDEDSPANRKPGVAASSSRHRKS